MKLVSSKSEQHAVFIRIAGDSGDGMQITGAQLSNAQALAGNDLQTLPDFPAEIRAPAGTTAGVSGFQLGFSDHPIHTPGDQLDILVVMNPAALKVNLPDLEKHGMLIVNSDNFDSKDLKKAGYAENPLESDDLKQYQLITMPITTLTLGAIEGLKLTRPQAKKCKNMFTLGVLYWLFERSLDQSLEFIKTKFKDNPEIVKANCLALKAGYNFAITTELPAKTIHVPKALFTPGTYRQISGNEAIALGCAAVTTVAETDMLVAGYPITPASLLLQLMSQYKKFGITTFQAEDEIAAICSAMGAAFGGALALSCTSGPGLDLKSEGLGLAVIAELPLVLVDVQRAGPSTGMPTKSEQSDLLAAMYGRHGEASLPVIAPRSPSDCFDAIVEAFRIAITFMTPVILLSDANLANSSEPWLIPDIRTLPQLKPTYHTEPKDFSPYARNKTTLSRPWAIPGTPHCEHRIGGLEKDMTTGDVSYDPDNHQQMVHLRQQKINGIANYILEAEEYGNPGADLLVISWGSTYGSVLTAVEDLQDQGHSISMVHLRHLNPLPLNLEAIVAAHPKVIVPENNSGQLSKILRAKFAKDILGFNKISGKPFLIEELKQKFLTVLAE